jgi:hypothetical protein
MCFFIAAVSVTIGTLIGVFAVALFNAGRDRD